MDGQQLDRGDAQLMRCSITAGWARPAYVPRSSSGTSAMRMVRLRTWVS